MLQWTPWSPKDVQAPPSRRERVRGVAQLGGFCARRGDGEPGLTASWQGTPRLQACIEAVETHRPVNALETWIMVST